MNVAPTPAIRSDAGDAGQALLVRAAQLRMLADGTNTAIVVSLINVGLIVFVQRAVIEPSLLIGWAATMVLVLVVRLSLNAAYYRVDPPVEETARWTRRFTLATLMTGTAWGSVGILLTPAESLPHQVFIAFICAGMGAGAMASLYPVRSAYVAYVVPLLVPLIARLFTEPDEMHVVMGVMVSLFLLYILFAAGRLRATLEETLTLRFANRDLGRNLEAEATARMGSDLRYRKLVENAADAIFVHDARGRLLDVNQQACDTLGYDRDELLAMTVFDIEKGVDPEVLSRMWWEADAERYPVTLEGEHVRRDGSVFPVEVRLGLLDDIDDVRFVAMARDITERRRVERMKSEFISTVSHELRTPLTSIVGSLGLIAAAAGGGLPEKARGLVEMAERNARRLIDLVNDILDFDKLQSGQMGFSFADVDLAVLVREAVEVHEGFALQHDVRVECAADLPSAVVWGDAKRLAQVLSNLLSNAVKFSNPGDAVAVSLHVEGGRARVDVADRGEGIPAAFRDKIFSRFSQAGDATTRRQGGTGLGLAISKAIVDAHRGTIGFDSEEGVGSMFYFDVPLKTAADAATS